MLKTLKTLHGQVTLPTFFPDGTRGVVKSVDSVDLEKSKVEGLVINTYHLLVHGMVDKIQRFSGIHHFMNWDRPIITDSGGFQAMSLIHDHPDIGKITDNGLVFLASQGDPLEPKGGQKVVLTPEKSIQTQLELGCDIAIALDDCTRPDMSLKDQEKSVKRTVAWANRSKEEFDRLTNCHPELARLAARQVSGSKMPKRVRHDRRRKRPLLFAVVQGGSSKKLRKYCAQELIKLNFDGYCFGGFPVDNQGKFLTEIVKYTTDLIPDDKPKFALGVGKPEDIIKCVKMGYQIFDCVIPTREARHGKLYIYTNDPKNSALKKDFCSTVYIKSGKYQDDPSPVSKYCDCLICQNYSKAYLYHLFKVGDSLAGRLATIHNLRFYSMLLEKLKLGKVG